jgi:hypothetical protein
MTLDVNDADLMWDILNIPPTTNEFKRYRMTHGDTWLTKKREVLQMKDMEISHIINCMNMLEGIKQDDTRAYMGLIRELTRRTK